MNDGAEVIRAWTPWVMGVWFGVLFAAERLRPLRSGKRGRRGVGRNAVAVALAFGTAAVTVGPVMAWSLNWTLSRRFGLMHRLPLPAPLAGVAAVLLMDLAFYYWHRLNHVVPVLWRFHNVHHIDPHLDSTTAFRFHFAEIAYSAGFRFVQILAIGPGALAFAVYEMLFLGGTLFHHANIRLPIRWERRINRIVVTPRMHGIHHSVIRDETNANYSVVFRWWDSLHRTLRLNIPQDDIGIGVAAYRREPDHTLRSILLLPMRRQRAYWIAPDGLPSRTRPGWDARQRGQMAA